MKSYKSEEGVDKLMPEKRFGAGMYEEEDKAQHESGVLSLRCQGHSHVLRIQLPGRTSVLGCDPSSTTMTSC